MYCVRCFSSRISSSAALAGTVTRSLTRNSMRGMADLRRSSSKYRGKGPDPDGPMNWRRFGISAGLVALMFGAGYMYKRNKEVEMERERRRSLGKASIGGPFELVDQDGKVRTNKDFLGKWLIIYFGFSHCPDVCPDELEKLVKALDIVKKSPKADPVQPLFITVDPARDDPKVLKEYLREFSDDIIGLTGNEEQVKQASKSYRVYYSAGPKLENDYIVDHTIIMYLIDAEGQFVDYYGQNKTAEEVANGIILSMAKNRAIKSKNWL